MLAQLLRVAGFAAFLLTGLIAAAGLIVVVVAAFTGRPRLLTGTVIGLFAWLGCYALAVLAGPLFARRQTLALGDEMAFCGVDCHLHLSVTAVTGSGDLAVRLRLRSDAKAVSEEPSHLRIRVVDAAGHEYAPRAAPPLEPLPPGAEYLREVHFALPAGATAERLVVTWGDWPDYVVPGPENALVQRRRSVLLTAPAAHPG
jgi:hypothetical protein